MKLNEETIGPESNCNPYPPRRFSYSQLVSICILAVLCFVSARIYPRDSFTESLVSRVFSLSSAVLFAVFVFNIIHQIKISTLVRTPLTIGIYLMLFERSLVLVETFWVHDLLSVPLVLENSVDFLHKVTSILSGLLVLLGAFFALLELGEKTRCLASEIQIREQAERERELLQQRMNAKSQLESLGLLAGGIAHDFNNLLTNISCRTTLILEDLPPHSPLRESLLKIEAAGHHGANLSKQILAYSGKGNFLVGPLNLSTLLAADLPEIRSSLQPGTELQLNLPQDIPIILGDADQISQMVTHLVDNSVDAVQGEGGIVSLSTGIVDQIQDCEGFDYLGEPLHATPYVYVQVSDNGPGMDEDTRSKIFNPFFSKNKIGRGLGLAAVMGIVRAHTGLVKVDSSCGSGTTLTTYFPVTDLEISPNDESLTPLRNTELHLKNNLDPSLPFAGVQS